LLFAGLLALAILATAERLVHSVSGAGLPASASQEVSQVWERARESGSYRFTADIVQTAMPATTVENVGRRSQTDTLHVEGQTNLGDGSLEMTLWSNGGSVLDAGSGVQVRVEGDEAFVRQGGGPGGELADQEWQPVEDFTGLFAPQSDFMTYLVAAKDIVDHGVESHSGFNFNRYGFTIDGPAYAGYVRDQMQAELQRSGELPPGMKLELPEQYVQMNGSGELWVSPQGLPLRQVLQLEMPGSESDQISAAVTVNFMDFGVAGESAIVLPSSAEIGSALTTIITLAAVAVLCIVIAANGRTRKVYAVIMLFVIFSMLLSPFFMGRSAQAFSDRQAEQAAAQAARGEESAMQQALTALQNSRSPIEAGALAAIQADPGVDADRDGMSNVQERLLGANPLSSSPQAGLLEIGGFELPLNDATDTDGDGLTDYTEAILGTLAEFVDSDGDGVDDPVELAGFEYNGQTWYGDPLEMDTNRDGIDDGREWLLDLNNDNEPDDTDSDGVPDLFDEDNDGDNVPDHLDVSPYTKGANTFDESNPLELTLDNLGVNRLSYVEFQLRPVDADHLWYAFNVLDWPDGDRTGTMQDDDGATYFDQDNSLPRSPNGNGDVQLVPMLEIRISGTPDHLPDEETLARYGIAAQELPNGRQGLYVPLQLTGDERGQEQVAFYGKMVYLPESAQWGSAHQVRLVWVVQAMVDVCEEFTDGVCSSYSARNDVQVIHTYHDPFTLTGLNVRENHRSDVALIYEDPAVDDDPQDDTNLWKLSHGLEGTFLAGRASAGPGGTLQRDITVATIYDRFNHSTNDAYDLEQRWNISDTLGVDTANYLDLDAAVMTTAMTETRTVLNDHFTPAWTAQEPITPTILFAREDEYRSFNLDELTGANGYLIRVNGRHFTMDLAPANVAVQTLASVNWAPFQYDGANWSAYPIELYWDELGRRHSAEFAVEYPDPEEAGGALGLAQTYYVALYRGIVNIVKSGDVVLQRQYFTSDKPLGAKFGAATQGGAMFITKIIANALIQPSRALKWFNAMLTNYKTYRIANPLSVIGEGLGSLLRQFQTWWQTSRLSFGLAMAATVAVVAAVAVAAYFLVTTYLSGDPGARIAAAVVVGTITGYLGVVAPLLAMRDMYRVVSTVNSSAGKLAALRSVALSAGEMGKAAKIAGVVGLVIAIGVIWGVFIYAAVTSGAAPGSVAFNSMLAQAIAATIVAVMMFVISLTVVGAILVAIISVIDLILTLLGNDFTISGWVTETLAKAIYHFELTVDSDVETGGFDLTLLDPARGLEAGRTARVSLPVTTTVTHDNPGDPRTIIYLPEYWTASNLRSTTFRYSLSLDETDMSVGRSDMRSDWEVQRHHTYLSNGMYQGVNTVTPSVNVEMTAGINVALPVHMGSAYALPGVECWTIYQPFIPPFYFPLCLDKTIRGNNDTLVGEALVLDIMPASLDDFYRLDWGGAVQFADPLDHDGDGLISRAQGGNDPDDSLDQCDGGPCWDSDDDGLSDRYELQIRAMGVANGGARISPLANDTDVDGLCDLDEIRLGTRPDLRDTDGDGLTDGEEVRHQDRCDNNGNSDTSEWLGGWTFTATYTDTLGVDQTLTTLINSDPLSADADGDGMTDLAEKTLHELDPVAYPFNPYVFNEAPIALYLALGDEDRVVGPGQTVAVTTTVQNNLAGPLFALGGVTTTLPAALGGHVFSRTYNLSQGLAASIVENVTVTGGSTLQTTIDAEFLALLHDGDTSLDWEWEPPLLFEDKNLTGIYPRRAALAALYGADNDYALVTVEGTNATTISSAEPLLFGNPQGRQAVATIGDTIGLSPTPSGIAGSSQPAIAANNAGETLSAWPSAHWYNCADVLVDNIYVTSQGDQSGGSEYYINRSNSANGAGWSASISDGWGERLWTDPVGGRVAGATISIGLTRTLCEGDTLAIWEDDGSDLRVDDFVCNLAPLTAPSSQTLNSWSCADGGDTSLLLRFRVIPDAEQDWLGRNDYNCAELYLDNLEVIQSDDHNGASEYYINLNGHHWTLGGLFFQNPAAGTRIWTDSGSANSGDTRTINTTWYRVCRGDTLDIWEDDSGHSLDDYICSLPMLDNPTAGLPAATAEGVSVDLTCNGTGDDHDRLELRMTIRPNPKYMIAGAILNADGTVKHSGLPIQNFEAYDYGCIFGFCQRKEYRHMHYPAVASDGTNFLTAWQTEQGVIRFRTVSNAGALGSVYSLSTTGRANVDLVWTGTNYLAVWTNWSSIANGQIEMAYIGQNGAPGTTVIVANSAQGEYQPNVAYDPETGKALITYLIDIGGGSFRLVGRFVEGAVISSEFEIGTMSPYLGLRPTHDLAYDATNNTWLSAWDYYNSANSRREIHYVALDPDGVALLPEAVGVSVGGVIPTQLSVACSDPNAVAPNCAMLAVSDEATPQRLRLSRVFLRSVLPWLGEISGTNSLALTVDADAPTSTVVSLTGNQTIALTGTLVIGGDAEDPTSNIAGVEVSVNNGPWEPANGAESWTYAFTPAGDGAPSDGAYTIQTRATDIAGNVEIPTAGITIYVDNSPPQVTSDISGNPIIGATREDDDRWHLAFSGSAADAAGSLSAVEGLVTPNGGDWQPAVLNGGLWTLDYALPFADAGGEAITDPTGQYTLLLRATDNLGNQTPQADALQVQFQIDATPPVAALGAMPDAISGDLTLTGVITDPGSIASGVQALEIDLVPSGQITNSWQAATLQQSGVGVTSADWEYVVPAGIEGNYQINLRGTDASGGDASGGDAGGNRNDNLFDWFSGWQGEVDTLAPRATVTMSYEGAGNAAVTRISASIQDMNLTEEGLEFPCRIQNRDRVQFSATWWDEISSGTPRLYELHPECVIPEIITTPVSLRVFDAYGYETVVTATLPAEVPPGPLLPEGNAKQPAAGLTAAVTGGPESQVGIISTPLLASTVLTPTHEGALDSLLPATITGGAYAVNYLKALTLTVDGATVYTTTWPTGTVTDTLWTTTWTPPGEGVYNFLSLVEDWSGAIQTELQPISVTVDTQAPALTLGTTLLTSTDQVSPGRVALTGAVSDNVGLENVRVSVDGLFTDGAAFDVDDWRYLWNIGSLPDGQLYEVTVEAEDAVRTTTITETVLVDLAPPAVVTPTLAYLDALSATVPLSPGDTVNDGSTLVLDWTASTDGSGLAGYFAGWTSELTPTVTALTAYGPADTLHHEATVSEASAWVAHILTDDAHGNRTSQSFGPVYVDAPTTPDYINPLDGLGGVYRGWMENGCTLIGADSAMAINAAGNGAWAEVQKLYLSWDSANLRLAWTGADWNADGDLSIYLDTATGGATAAYNPYGSPATISLPAAMEADYLVFIEDGATASLYHWDGSAWVADQALTAPNYMLTTDAQPATTDLYLPFAWLGSPATLKLAALATEEAALRVWAAMPDKNPLNSERSVNSLAIPYLDSDFDLVHAYEWATPGAAGVCPAAGHFEGADLQTSLSSQPAGLTVGYLQHDLPGLTAPSSTLDADLDGEPDNGDLPFDIEPSPIGQGATVEYTLHIANEGEAEATNVVVTATASGGLEFPGTTHTVNVGTIPAGGSTDVTFSALVNTALGGESAEIGVVVSDAVHGPFDWWWTQHDIDTAGPEDVEIVAPVTYIGPFTNTIRGTVSDRSAVPTIDLQVVGGSTQSCTDPTSKDGEWLCLWDAGGADHGDTFQLQARGTDIWGNTGSYGPIHTVTVDAQIPTLALNTATLDALSDDQIGPTEVGMGGSVTDESLAGQAEVCALVNDEASPNCALLDVSPGDAPSGDWFGLAPLGGDIDGWPVTLSFTGLDAAGNRSLVLTRTVTVDLRAPQIIITELRELVSQNAPVSVIEGTATDGSGVASLEVQVTAPDNSFVTVPLTLSGDEWGFSTTFTQAGLHYLGLAATDTYGNRRVLGTYDVLVIDAGVNLPPTVNLPAGYVVDEGATVVLDSNATDFNNDPLTYAWDLDNDGDFDDGDTATVVFDATNLDGPSSYPVSVSVTDSLSDAIIASTTVEVENVAPHTIVLSLSAAEISENGSVELSGTFADGGVSDTHTVDIDWGDGSSTQDVAAGSLAFGPVAHTYLDDDPTGTPFDVYQVTVTVTDNDSGSGTAETTVTVNNVLPSLADVSATAVNENNETTLTGEIVDAGTLDNFSLQVDWGDGSSPDNFAYAAGERQFSLTHTYRDDDDDDSYTIALTVTDDDNGEILVEAIAEVLNVEPVVEATPLTQELQYSDGFGAITVTADDVIGDPLAIDTTWSVGGGSPSAGLFAGASLAADGCENHMDYTQTCSWTISGVGGIPAGEYLISAAVSDGDGGQTTVDVTVNVGAEDAAIQFNGNNPVAVQVDAPGSNTSQAFSMTATVEELEPDVAAYLAAPGNISLAQVSMTLVPVGPGSTVTGVCTPVLTGSGDSYADYLTVTCGFDNAPVNSYNVALTVAGGYYEGHAEDVIVVYDPSLGFPTGGGLFFWPGSADPNNGYPGDLTTFSFVMKYVGPQNNLTGALWVTRYLPDGTFYQFVSTNREGLSVGATGAFDWAAFTGKGMYREPGWPNPVGDYSFSFYVEDHGEPGINNDRVWLEIRDADGNVVPVSSMATPAAVQAVKIAGGNTVVHYSGNRPPTADFIFSTNDLAVQFTDKSKDPGGSVVAWAWEFGDGGTSTSRNPSHAYAAIGTYDVQLTVTDKKGLISSTTKQVTVATQMYIGDLQAGSTMNGSNKWNAEVTVLVLSDAGMPVAGATVTGNWSAGATGSGSCTTGPTGTCKVTRTKININVSSVTFTVTNVTHATLTYNPALNVETSIVVTKPN